jgi:hypothetical protein
MRLVDYTAHVDENGLPVLVMTIEVPVEIVDYTAHVDENGLPVLVMPIEVPVEIDVLGVPDEVRYVLNNLIRSKLSEKKND